MKRTELKIPATAASDRPKDCLAFAYRAVNIRSDHLWEDIHKAAEVGRQLLAPVSTELRRRGHEATEPLEGGSKSFGAVRMTSRIDDIEIGIGIRPAHGDQWYIRAGCLHLGNPPRRPTVRELAALEEARTILAAVVSEQEGTHDLRWVSRTEAEGLPDRP